MKVFGPLGVIDYAYEEVSKVCSQGASAQNLNKELEMCNKVIQEQKWELIKAYVTVGIFFRKESYQLAEKIAESTVKEVHKCDSLASVHDTFKPLKQSLEKTMEEKLQDAQKKYSVENLWEHVKKVAQYG